MTLAMSALQKAVFQALSSDNSLMNAIGTGKIFDTLPDRIKPPYVVLGRSTVSDWSTSTEDGEAIVFFVHIWTGHGDRQQNNVIQDHIKSALAAAEFPVATYTLVNLRFQLAETRHDRINALVHGVMRFRAVLEPLA